MEYSDAWDAIFKFGTDREKGEYITVNTVLGPIWKEISDLRAQVEELQYQLRVEKAKNV